MVMYVSTRGKWNGFVLDTKGEILRDRSYTQGDRGDAEKELARMERAGKRKGTRRAWKCEPRKGGAR